MIDLAHSEIGQVYFDQEQYQAAIDAYEQALEADRQLGDRSVEAMTLNSLANAHSLLNQYSQALELQQQILEIARDSRDRQSEVTALQKIGDIYKVWGRYPDALENYQQALAIAEEQNDRSAVTGLHLDLGSIYDSQGQYALALEQYQRALTLNQETQQQVHQAVALNSLETVCQFSQLEYPGNADFSGYINNLINRASASGQNACLEISRSQESTILHNMATTYNRQGQFQEALNLYQQSLDISIELHDRGGQAPSLTSIGDVYQQQGQYGQALDYYRQALALFQAVGDRIGASTTLNQIGSVYVAQGEYAEAIASHQQALEVAQSVTNARVRQAGAITFLGDTYTQVGQYRQALTYYQQALDSYREIGQRSDEAQALANIGTVYLRQNQYSQALDFYQRALAIQREIGIISGESQTLKNMGLVYTAQGQLDRAIPRFEDALAIQRSIGARSSIGYTLQGLGLAYQKQGDATAAIELFGQAVATHRETGDRAGEAQALSDLGAAYWRSRQLPQAESTLYAAMTMLESLRASELNDSDTIALVDTQESTYETLQQVLIAQNKIASALEVAERGRARAFVKLLASELSNRLATSIDQTAPNFAQIQRIAQQHNATLVNYSVINSDTNAPALYIWVVQPTGIIHFESVDLSTLDRPLSELVSISRDAIGARSRTSGTVVAELTPAGRARQQAQQRQNLQQLYQLLIDPIAAYLPSNPEERVIFVPQGELFLVPFPALVDRTGSYLIEHHTILSTPSIQVLDFTHQQQAQARGDRSQPLSPANVLVVGNPIMPSILNPIDGQAEQLESLPATETEALAIAQAFHTQPLMWNQATEPAVVQRMQTARLIHLATHGLLEYGNPQDSGVQDFPGAIALAAANGTDGLLTSAEIRQMHLNAELVVLSACDTGRGRITGDGVIGLSRSLISAGVPSIIVSLWSVPDAPTADLMIEFYRQWQHNPDRAQALRQAMLITMQFHPDPRDWAAFTLIGEAE